MAHMVLLEALRGNSNACNRKNPRWGGGQMYDAEEDQAVEEVEQSKQNVGIITSADHHIASGDAPSLPHLSLRHTWYIRRAEPVTHCILQFGGREGGGRRDSNYAPYTRNPNP